MVVIMDVGVSSSLSLSGTPSRICQADVLTENQGMPSSAPVEGERQVFSRELTVLESFRMGMPRKETPCLVPGEHVLDLLVRQCDLLDGLALVLQGRIVVIDVRGQEELGIPFKALAGGKIRDKPRWAILVPDVDSSGLGLRESGAQQTRSTLMHHLLFLGRVGGLGGGGRRGRVSRRGRAHGAVGFGLPLGLSGDVDGGRHGGWLLPEMTARGRSLW